MFVKKFLSVVLSLLLFFSAFMYAPFLDNVFAVKTIAASAEDLTFTLNSDGQTYSVTDCNHITGYRPFEITIPSTYQGKKVVSIGAEAFTNSGLLEKLIIPETVTSIGEKAFYNCNNLKSISIPGSVTSIGAKAFWGCGLSVHIKNISEWCQIDFADHYSNPLESGSLYLNDSKVEDLVIPSNVTTIKPFAFYGYYSLKSLVVPDSVKTIGEKAFYDCGSLMTVKIGSGLTKISNSTFESCQALTSVDIGPSVTAIGEKAFADCESLVNVCFGEKLKTIGRYAFNYCGLRTVVLPDSVTSIGVGAFQNCQKLTSIILSKNIQKISSATFQWCLLLKSIVIPENVKYINSNAFYGCKKLEWVALPNSVISFGTDAFYDTVSIESIYYTGTQAEWGKIEIPESNDYANQYVLDAYRHYKCTETYIEPSCKQVGKLTYTCGTCDCPIWISESVTIDIPVKHSFLTYRTVDKQATCTESGSESYHCTLCDEKKDPVDIPALGHLYSTTWTIDKAATCTQTGSKSHHCNRCDSKKDVTTIPATGHKSEKDAAVGATCTTAGKTEGSHCSVCGKIIKVQAIIPATGHTPSSWLTDKAATVNSAGSKHRECTECGEVLETAVIPQLTCAAPKLTGVANAANGVKITWGKVSGADKYRVYRKIKGGAWEKVCDTTATAILDKKAKSGTTYYYTVRAFNEAGGGSYNKTGLAIRFVGTPKLAAIANGKNYVQINWGKVAGADGYIVYRKASGEKGWTKIATVKGGSTVKYRDTKVASGKGYTYTVRAYDGNAKSSYNATGLTIKFLSMPKLSKVTSAKSGVTVKWGKVAGAAGYIVYRKTGNGGWQKIVTVNGNTAVSYLDTTAKKGTTYTYTVKAYSGSYTSAHNTTGLKIKDKY